MDETKNAVKTNSNLLRDIQKYRVIMSGLKGNRVNNLQDLTMLNKIANLNCVQKDIVKGWMGKSKGLLQIVWERGFVDLNGGVRIYSVTDCMGKPPLL